MATHQPVIDLLESLGTRDEIEAAYLAHLPYSQPDTSDMWQANRRDWLVGKLNQLDTEDRSTVRICANMHGHLLVIINGDPLNLNQLGLFELVEWLNEFVYRMVEIDIDV